VEKVQLLISLTCILWKHCKNNQQPVSIFAGFGCIVMHRTKCGFVCKRLEVNIMSHVWQLTRTFDSDVGMGYTGQSIVQRGT